MSGPFSTTPIAVSLVLPAAAAVDVEQQELEAEKRAEYEAAARAYLMTVLKRFDGQRCTRAVFDEVARAIDDAIRLPRPIAKAICRPDTGEIELQVDFEAGAR
ncbi:hypothetical protein [Burkholderia multivorans]|uniref:hypothetical protein n=1 Tax=Burkholderia multivorans TaxID=87883 RepID=UPI0021C0024C|nr:hypothetical protein [Burkholderia multivorans]